MKGTVKFFNDSKGFGFIAGEDGKEYFVHVSGIHAGLSLRDADKVTFDVTMGDRGPKAINVALDRDVGPAAAPVAANDNEPAEDDSGDDSEEESDDDSEDDAEESDDELEAANDNEAEDDEEKAA